MERLNPAEATYDVMRPYGVWGVISPFNYPMALVAGPAGAALVAGNTVVLKPSEIGSWCAHRLYDVLVEAGVPAGVVNLVTGPGETTGAALVADDRLGGITFTGSSEVGMAIHRSFSRRLPAAGDLRDGRQEPGDRRRQRRPRPGRRGRRPLGVRARRAEVLGRVAGVRRRRRGRRVLRPAGGAGRRDPRRRARCAAAASCRRSSTRRRSPATRRRSPRRGRVGEVVGGGTRLTDGELAHGNFVAPTVVRVPSDSSLWIDRAVRPDHRRRRRRLARRGHRPGQRHAVRAHRRAVRRRRRRRSTASSTASRPASSTSTGRPARRPARGPACSRSAAGSARAPAARPAAARTTCSSTCASRAARSSGR